MSDENADRVPKKTDWGGFSAAVVKAALQAFAVGLIGGGFLFYSYADPLSNLYDADMADPLLNLNVIAMLCRQSDLKEVASNDKSACKLAVKKQTGGAQPTQYVCRLPRSIPSASKQSKPECQAPYSYYPGKETVKLMVNYSNRLWTKIGTDIAETRKAPTSYLWRGWPILTAVLGFFGWLGFWLPIIGSNGKIPVADESGENDANKGGAFSIWLARTQALTWSTYRYILACIFTFSSSIKEDPSPVFHIQFFAYLYAGFMSAISQAFVPLILPFVSMFYQLFDYADECTNDAVPGLPLSINVLYCCLPIFSQLNFIYSFTVLPVVGMLYFTYLIIFAPMLRDKKLYLSTLQCNQKFLGLVFATLVAIQAPVYLDETSSGSFLAAYAILVLYYLYSNKEWFKAILSG